MKRKFLIPTLFVIVIGLRGYHRITPTGCGSQVSIFRMSSGPPESAFPLRHILRPDCRCGHCANLYYVGRFTRTALETDASLYGDEMPGASLLRSNTGYLLIAAVLVLIMGNVGSSQWPTLLR